MYEPDYGNEGPGWEQQEQAMEERMRDELDSLLAVHKHGLPNEAKRLAGFLGLSKQLQQEIDAHARTASVGR